MNRQTMAENEDSFLQIGRICEIAEFIHDEWMYVHASNNNQSINVQVAQLQLEIAELLATVQRGALQCIEKLLSMLSLYPLDLIKPLVGKIEKKSTVQISDLLSFPEFSSPFPSGNVRAIPVDEAAELNEQQVAESEGRVRKQYGQLTKRLDSQSIAIRMFQLKAITLADRDEIKAKRAEPHRAAEVLLEILLRRWQTVGRTFLNTLKEVNQDDIYLQLLGFDLSWDVQQTIQRRYDELVNTMDTTTGGLLVEMLSNGVLSLTDTQEIETERASHLMNGKLLSIMSRKTQKMFDAFLTCLENTGQIHVAEILRGKNLYTTDTPASTTSSTHLARNKRRLPLVPPPKPPTPTPAAVNDASLPAVVVPQLRFQAILELDQSFVREPVDGVTTLGNYLYVWYKMRRDIAVYDKEVNQLLGFLPVPELGKVSDLASCEINMHLYVSDLGKKVIHSINIASNQQTKWNVRDKPDGLSVTSECHLIVTCPEVSKIKIFTPQGKLVKRIRLKNSGIFRPLHTVQLDSGDYLVSHGDKRDTIHRICVVDDRGCIQQSLGGYKGSRDYQFQVPIRLALLKNNFCVVADAGNKRLVTVNRPPPSYMYLSGHPCSLWYDKNDDRLYVAVNEVDSGGSERGDVAIFSFS